MKHLLLFTVVMMLLASCSSDEPGGKAQNINLSRSEQEILDAQKDFSVNFFKSVYASEDAKKNILVSPLSMSMAFSMVANGAEGETLAEITRALGFSSGELEEVNNLNKTLLRRLPSMDSGTTVAIANSVWANEGELFNSDFSKTVAGDYNAESQSVDLYSESGMHAINEWANSKTNGMVPKVLDEPLKALFAICNSLYFEGKWSVEFDPEKTRRESFNNADGSTSQVYMMHQSTELECYFENLNGDQSREEGRQVIRKSYGAGAYLMTLVLPSVNETLSEMVNSIDATTLRSWESRLSDRQIYLGIPRFEYEYGRDDFKDQMCALGIVKAFQPDAELPAILQHGVMLDKVIQKSKIKVDESGAKVATTTVVSGIDIGQPRSVTFDRPFMYYISEQSTGAILFMGCVNAF